MLCSLIKPYTLKRKKKKEKNCVLLSWIRPQVVAQKGGSSLFPLAGSAWRFFFPDPPKSTGTDLSSWRICSSQGITACLVKVEVLVCFADQRSLTCICSFTPFRLRFQGAVEALHPCVLPCSPSDSMWAAWLIFQLDSGRGDGGSRAFRCMYIHFYVGAGCFSSLLFKLKS